MPRLSPPPVPESSIISDRPLKPVRGRAKRLKEQQVERRQVGFKTPQQWFAGWDWETSPAGPDCGSPQVREYLDYVWHELTGKRHPKPVGLDYRNLPPYALK